LLRLPENRIEPAVAESMPPPIDRSCRSDFSWNGTVQS
jgi:hypothetical protein